MFPGMGCLGQTAAATERGDNYDELHLWGKEKTYPIAIFPLAGSKVHRMGILPYAAMLGMLQSLLPLVKTEWRTEMASPVVGKQF